MRIEAYDLDSLRALVRSLQAENRNLRELLEENTFLSSPLMCFPAPAKCRMNMTPTRHL